MSIQGWIIAALCAVIVFGLFILIKLMDANAELKRMLDQASHNIESKKKKEIDE